MYLII